MEILQLPGAPLLVSPLLGQVPGLVHGISTRAIHPEGARAGTDPRAAARLARLLDWMGSPPITAHQVHGAGVALVDTPPGDALEADALLTARPGLLLAVRVADCLPLLAAPRSGGAVVVVHAGWRGVAAGVVETGIAALGRLAGTGPEELLAAVGPGIGGCCFEVGPEVAEAVAGDRSDLILPGDRGRPYLDLRRAVVSRLRTCGLSPESIDAEAPCTACRTDLFFSYRREGAGTGRVLAAAGYPLSMV
jgi:YfiH family protein